jgi:hypothetical protein
MTEAGLEDGDGDETPVEAAQEALDIAASRITEAFWEPTVLDALKSGRAVHL